MRKESVFVSVALLVWLTANSTVAAIRYSVTNLGTLPGYNVSQPYSINNLGQIAGFVTDFDHPVYHRAVLFDPNGGGNDIDLGTLGGEGSAALSINNNGQIVGAGENAAVPSFWYATIFDPNGTGNNTALNPEGAAWQINDNGQIAGWVFVEPYDGANDCRRAVLFEPSAEPNMVNLGTLAGYSDSEALSINENSLIVGTAYNPNLPYPYADARAVLLDPTGHADNVDLGTLPGYESAIPFSVNNRGQIVGRANNHDMSILNWNPRAVLFDHTGEGDNIDLGTLPGYDSAEALSINNKGWTVGRAIISQTFTCRAVLFDRKLRGNNIDLNDCIDPALGCTLTEAISINDNGWIVCWGAKSGTTVTSFLLKPISAGPADFEPDSDVDLEDFAILAAAWKSRAGDDNWNPSCDISDPQDGLINGRDLLVLCRNYLTATP